jgi:poly-beta-1,6-N-acetyl-D-glucosamine synthase
MKTITSASGNRAGAPDADQAALVATYAYVLITPARDEAKFIEKTIQSVVAQTVLPLKWVIVSDGSTDGTDDIISRYASQHPWIELVRMPERRERSFAGKVHAFNAGYARVRDLEYEAIGSMDGDISFEERYFSFLLAKLAEDPRLGLVGTPFKDGSNAMYDYRFVNPEHVSGACQLFRRQCFEDVGGYIPIRAGGIDYVAVISARMKGWKTRTFTEQVSLHHRKMGTAEKGMLAARFAQGKKDYTFGNHPLWEGFRAVYQMSRTPLVVGGVLVMLGYLWALLRHADRPIPMETVAFIRREQMSRLRKFVGNVAGARPHEGIRSEA